MLQFWKHKRKEPEQVDLRKVKYHLNVLADVIECIAMDIKNEDSIKKKEVLMEKLRKLLSNRAWFAAIHDVDVMERQDKLKKENIAYCLYCDIIKEYDTSYCSEPEIRCGKNLSGSAGEKIEKYKETIE